LGVRGVTLGDERARCDAGADSGQDAMVYDAWRSFHTPSRQFL
jgi:hypothetical protein